MESIDVDGINRWGLMESRIILLDGSPKNYLIKYSTLDFHHNGEFESKDT
jgi:hypothetical protein